MSAELPPIDTSRRGPARSVTAPELAQALERLPAEHQDRISRIAEHRRSSSDSKEDKLNDLAAEPEHNQPEVSNERCVLMGLGANHPAAQRISNFDRK